MNRFILSMLAIRLWKWSFRLQIATQPRITFFLPSAGEMNWKIYHATSPFSRFRLNFKTIFLHPFPSQVSLCENILFDLPLISMTHVFRRSGQFVGFRSSIKTLINKEHSQYLVRIEGSQERREFMAFWSHACTCCSSPTSPIATIQFPGFFLPIFLNLYLSLPEISFHQFILLFLCPTSFPAKMILSQPSYLPFLS